MFPTRSSTQTILQAQNSEKERGKGSARANILQPVERALCSTPDNTGVSDFNLLDMLDTPGGWTPF